mmetsp:Transcript_49715/g.101050  ORF Transcript_49715/g.101050 Transcript_49715/m.101050 type:complete len:387 (-) Transcript_49715:104-1264(-)
MCRSSFSGAACKVARVQQLVRLVAIGLLEPLVVERLDHRVVVRAAQRLALVDAVHGLLALGQDGLVGRARLAAAANAAARARHDLDEVVLALTGLHLGDELLCVAQSIGHRDAQLQAVRHLGLDMSRQWRVWRRCHLECGLLNTLKTAHIVVHDIVHGLALDQLDNCPQCGLHHAAGGTKQLRPAAAGAQWVVKLLLLQLHQVDAGVCKHGGGLDCCDDVVDVAATTALIARTVGLALLTHTRHQRARQHVARLDAGLGREEVLDDGAHHHLGRLARREVRDELGVRLLDHGNPARAARCEHGHWLVGVGVALEVVRQAVKQLRALLHDGQISSQKGIKDTVKAQLAQACDELASGDGAWRQPKCLRDGHTHRRRDRNHRQLALVA